MHKCKKLRNIEKKINTVQKPERGNKKEIKYRKLQNPDKIERKRKIYKNVDN